MSRYPVAAIITVTLLSVACGGHDVYRDETFSTESPYKKSFNVSAEKACQGAQMAMLSQAYKINRSEKTEIAAQKDFQPDDDTNVTIELHVICKDFLPGSIIFANALQTTYELKKSRQSTSVGIPSVGSISVPLGKTTESLVKVGGETISDKEYYSRFFALVQTYLEPQKGQFLKQ